jgi:hypothetical protein
MGIWVTDVHNARTAVTAAVTEFVIVRSAEVIPLLDTPPALIGRFDDLEMAWRLAEALARAGADVETRAILT